MTAAEFQALDSGNEGLGNRFYAAIRESTGLTELLDVVKTKRYAYSRVRRMALWAYLGLSPAEIPGEIPYLRVLAANETGRALLGKMRKCASTPVLTKPADVRKLDPAAQNLFAWEARATDLYTLGYPDLSAAGGGAEWRINPVMI
jgi:predicted nucleotidyltransferase